MHGISNRGWLICRWMLGEALVFVAMAMLLFCFLYCSFLCMAVTTVLTKCPFSRILIVDGSDMVFMSHS